MLMKKQMVVHIVCYEIYPINPHWRIKMKPDTRNYVAKYSRLFNREHVQPSKLAYKRKDKHNKLDTNN